jgi:hypothetical protein
MTDNSFIGEGSKMNRFTRSGLGAAAIASILCTGVTGHADEILAAGSIYGGPKQVRAVCYVYNAGDAAFALSVPEIRDQNGQFVTLEIEQCGLTLGAGRSCGVAANIANNSAYSCRVIVKPPATARGILEVRDVNQNVLQNIELR